MLIFWHTFRSKKSCWLFGTLCILYCTYTGGEAPPISKIQNTKCANKSTWFFGSKSVPKNQHKLHVINNYISKLWERTPNGPRTDPESGGGVKESTKDLHYLNPKTQLRAAFCNAKIRESRVRFERDWKMKLTGNETDAAYVDFLDLKVCQKINISCM